MLLFIRGITDDLSLVFFESDDIDPKVCLVGNNKIFIDTLCSEIISEILFVESNMTDVFSNILRKTIRLYTDSYRVKSVDLPKREASSIEKMYALRSLKQLLFELNFSEVETSRILKT